MKVYLPSQTFYLFYQCDLNSWLFILWHVLSGLLHFPLDHTNVRDGSTSQIFLSASVIGTHLSLQQVMHGQLLPRVLCAEPQHLLALLASSRVCETFIMMILTLISFPKNFTFISASGRHVSISSSQNRMDIRIKLCKNHCQCWKHESCCWACISPERQ